MTSNKQTPIAWDYGHLTAEASEELAAVVLQQLATFKNDSATLVHAAESNQPQAPGLNGNYP